MHAELKKQRVFFYNFYLFIIKKKFFFFLRVYRKPEVYTFYIFILRKMKSGVNSEPDRKLTEQSCSKYIVQGRVLFVD
jgi:hypothetical protein